MKRIIALCGLVGLVGCFLPMAFGMSLFDLRNFTEGWTSWLVIAAFAAPTFLGFAKGESERAIAIASLVSFGYVAHKFGTGTFDLMIHGSLGGLAMGAAMIAGLAFSVLGLFASRRV